MILCAYIFLQCDYIVSAATMDRKFLNFDEILVTGCTSNCLFHCIDVSIDLNQDEVVDEEHSRIPEAPLETDSTVTSDFKDSFPNTQPRSQNCDIPGELFANFATSLI